MIDKNNTNISNTKERKKKLSETLSTIEQEINDLKVRKSEIESTLEESYNNFNDKVFGDSEPKRSDEELAILENIEESQTKISKYYDNLFSEKEGSKSIKLQINDFLSEAEGVKNNIINLHTDTTNLKSKSETDSNTINQLKTEIEAVKSSATGYLVKIEESKAQFDDFCDKISDRENKINTQDESIKKQSDKLKSLNEQSGKLLAEITDKSLHNAFKKEADKNQKQHKNLFFITLGVLAFGLVLFIGSMVIQVFGLTKLESYELWFIRLFTAAPFIFASWLCVHTASIKLKLAEEYQHKASITEALSGYREMWDLEHNAKEYQEMFNLISKDLIKNPADKIKFSYSDSSVSTRKKGSLPESENNNPVEN